MFTFVLYKDTALVFNRNMPTIKISSTSSFHLPSLPPFLVTAMDTASPTTASPTTPFPDDQVPVLVSTPQLSRSVGPFFAVMSVIIVLLALSCILGRLCGYRAEGPDSWYDCLGWCQRRCGRRRWFILGCGGGQREVRAAEAMDLDPKVGDSKQLSVPSPQP